MDALLSHSLIPCVKSESCWSMLCEGWCVRACGIAHFGEAYYMPHLVAHGRSCKLAWCECSNHLSFHRLCDLCRREMREDECVHSLCRSRFVYDRHWRC